MFKQFESKISIDKHGPPEVIWNENKKYEKLNATENSMINFDVKRQI